MTPRCWSCQYDLTGLRVEAVCPECGTPIWDSHPGSRERNRSSSSPAAPLGVLALLMLCFGPVACVPGLAAVAFGVGTLARIREGLTPPSAGPSAWLGLTTGCIATLVGGLVGLSVWL